MRRAQFSRNYLPSPPIYYAGELPGLRQANGKGWAVGGLCPFHDDSRAGSFYVNLKSGRLQMLRLLRKRRRRARLPPRAIWARLQGSGGGARGVAMTAEARVAETPKQAARRLSTKFRYRRKGYRPAGLHVYEDKTGTPLLYQLRLEHPKSGEKWIRSMYFDGERYD